MAKNNSNLHGAKKAKNDEFYTQLTDIEKECVHYRQHFNGKVVFCNCDDPLGRPCKDNEDIADCDERNCSAFALYFKKNL